MQHQQIIDRPTGRKNNELLSKNKWSKETPFFLGKQRGQSPWEDSLDADKI